MIRIGHGYDAHRLTEGRALVLGGVNIPFERGLDGHSDADVLLHALCDSLLGAASLGDIGFRFPDSDDKYRGISSLVLLKKTVGLLAEMGYSVVNCDVTVIAQSPKLAPYIGEMKSNIASVLGCSLDCVSVKATTEEHMGFTGSGEGISAHAVCLISD